MIDPFQRSVAVVDVASCASAISEAQVQIALAADLKIQHESEL
jgi:hypothetical protein